MSRLESLELSTISEDEVLDLQSISSPPEFIQILYLKEVAKLNSKASTPSQAKYFLVKLGLSYKAYGGVELHFEWGFTKLEVLQLRDLERLNSLVINNGAMPLLRELQIGPSPQPKEMPSSIHHLPNLTTLHLVN
ncbi:hypothetical protein DVH24_026068 [Malus domestica]|uniref:FBD domain-containing protein n=1 Tax=Malus domestica TaxID=3750 RepID=A0A498KMM9_MALDO|nr:hypothetical protein DVH24_026068 [Malus domestica]